MKSKEKIEKGNRKDKKNSSSNLFIFLKKHWLLLLLLLLCLIIIFSLTFYLITNWIGKRKFEKEIEEIAIINENPLISLEKIYCYSSATATNNAENKAMWDLDVSQYTDIALFLSIYVENKVTDGNNIIVERTPKNTISQIYIDQIQFANNSNSYTDASNNITLSYLPLLQFGKIETEEQSISEQQEETIFFEVVDEASQIVNNNVILDKPIVDKYLTLPLTLRYLNYHCKTNASISDIDTPLSFNGSLLKRAGIPLADIKNEITFTIHVVNQLQEEYIYHVNLEIPLQNDDNSQNIYDGSYTFEKELKNSYFYLKFQ